MLKLPVFSLWKEPESLIFASKAAALHNGVGFMDSKKKKKEMDWIDTSGLFCEVFDNVCFKEPSSKERDLQDKLWMLEVVNNGIWTERECSLVWNHMRDLKNGGARSSSSIWDHTTGTISDQITRHEVQLAPYYSHFEITEFSQYQIMIDLAVGLMKSGSKKAFTLIL